ncbi:MAG: translation initiation factor IF-3 [Lachnospiraceae bacterium]|nr:translation initiation factor IF-3 [Lachnospiraceae bacterium]
MNEQIREPEVRVLGANGEQLGIMSSAEALDRARNEELDLIMIAPTAKPPVVRIVDYGKFRYEQLRKQKEAKKKQKTTELKEIRLSPNIDVNDMKTKANQAAKFITKGDKVRVTLKFRGREMAHIQTGKEIMNTFCEQLSDIAVVDKAAKMEGRNLVVTLSKKREN